MWCPDSTKLIQARDVTFNENAMLSSGKKSIVSSTGTCHQKDANRKVEIEDEIAAAQGGVADRPRREVRAAKPSFNTTSPNQPYVEDIIPWPMIIL